MDENDIQKAIVQRRLPLDVGDKIISVVLAICIIGSIFGVIPMYIKWGLVQALIFLIIFPSLFAYMRWRWFWSNKQLITLPSNLSLEKKESVIDKLLTEPEMKPISKFWVTKKSNYYGFNFKKSFFQNYSVKLLYDESGYYLNSIIGFSQSANFSNENVSTIIFRIKQIENNL